MMVRLLRAMAGLVPLVGRAPLPRGVDRPVMGRGRARSYQVTPFVPTPEFSCVVGAGPRLDRSYERHTIGQEISGSQPRDGIPKPSSLAKFSAGDNLKPPKGKSVPRTRS